MSKAITNEAVLEAAKNHALEQLGKTQFNKNKDAVKSIVSDFIAGVQFLLSEVADKGELVNLVDKHLEYE